MARNRNGRGGGSARGGGVPVGGGVGVGGGRCGGRGGSGDRGRATGLLSRPSPPKTFALLPPPVVPADALCLVCATEAADWAIASPCGHAICGDCSHRLRVLYGEAACVLCKTALTDVLVVPAGLYDPLSGLPPPAGLASAAASDAVVGMRFVDAARREELAARLAHTCPACGFGDELPKPAAHQVTLSTETTDADGVAGPDHSCHVPGAPTWTAGTRAVNRWGTFSSLVALRSHVRAAHQSVFCDVCVAHRKAYVCEQILYPLDGDGSGIRGRSAHSSSKCRAHTISSHPACEFCCRPLYDEDALFAHLTRDHYSCFVCERAGRHHEYYRNYASLEAHYAEEHYMCAEQRCRGVVYANPVDLRLHQLQVHGVGAGGTGGVAGAGVGGRGRGRSLRVELSDLQVGGAGAIFGRGVGSGEAGRGGGGRVGPGDEERERRRRSFGVASAVFSYGQVWSRGGGGDGGGVGGGRGGGGDGNGVRGGVRSGVDVLSVREIGARDGGGRGGDGGGSDGGGIGGGGRSSSADALATPGLPGGSTAAVPSSIPASLGRGFQRRNSPCNSDEASRRNRELVVAMRGAVGAASFSRFRDASGDFRSGSLGARAYVASVMELFGRVPALGAFLPELAALLPAGDGLCEALCVACEEAAPAPRELGRLGGVAAAAERRSRRPGHGGSGHDGRAGDCGRGGGSGARSGGVSQSDVDTDLGSRFRLPFDPDAAVGSCDAESAFPPVVPPSATSRVDFPSLPAAGRRDAAAPVTAPRVGACGMAAGSPNASSSTLAPATPMVPTATYRLQRARDLTSSAAHFPPLGGRSGPSVVDPLLSAGGATAHALTSSMVRAGPSSRPQPGRRLLQSSSWSRASDVPLGLRPSAAVTAGPQPAVRRSSNAVASAALSLMSRNPLTDVCPEGRVWGGSAAPSAQATATQRRRAATEAVSVATADAALGRLAPSSVETAAGAVADVGLPPAPPAAAPARIRSSAISSLGANNGGSSRFYRRNVDRFGGGPVTNDAAAGGLALPPSSGRPVVDIGALMRNSQASALPMVSGSGLPWERRKLASKAAAAKQDWTAASAGSARQSTSSSSSATVSTPGPSSGSRISPVGATKAAMAVGSTSGTPGALSEALSSAGGAGGSGTEPMAAAADGDRDSSGAGSTSGPHDDCAYQEASQSEAGGIEDPASIFLGA